MIITRDWLLQHRTESGAWTRSQLDAIGIFWPPREGWMHLIIGTEINDQQRKRFERGKHIKKIQPRTSRQKRRNYSLF